MPSEPLDLNFADIAYQAPVAWAVVDLHGHLALANDAYAELFGYPRSELLTLQIDDLVAPDDRGRSDEFARALIDGGAARHEADRHHLRSDGSSFVGHVVASLLRDSTGAPVAMLGVVTDVSEARRLAMQVERNEERLSKMLTNISDTVTLVGDDGEIVATTGLHTSIMGYPSEFWATRSIFDLVHPDEAEEAAAMAANVLGTPGRELSGEFRLRHSSGHYEHVAITAINLLEDPAVEAVVLTSRNITAWKRGEAALQERRDEALRLAEQRVAFIASASHELRTPVHAVMGLAELLADSETDPDREAQIRAILAEARHLQDTVDGILDHARIEIDGVTLEPVPTDLREITERVATRAASTAHAATLDVRCRVADVVPAAVLVDPHRLEQVLTNLAGNAVKFTPSGWVRIDVSVEDDQLVLAVADSGPGIPPDSVDLIFEPFRQLATPGPGGSGLGLPIVAGLVRLMEGTIEVDTEPGRGSRFTVRLPLRPAEGSAVAGHQPGDATRTPVARRASILVVEDNPVNQMLIDAQLGRLGHRCTIVGTGQECLDWLSADRDVDLVLMDWQLPDIDGLETTRRLRARERPGDRHLPIVAVTASAMREDAAACLDAGMDDFLPKPVTLRDLEATIARWVRTGAGPEVVQQPPPIGPLDTLVEEIGDRGPIVRLVEQYLEELDGRVAALVHAHTEGSLDVAHRIGHSLGSTSEMLGADRLASVSRRIEATGTVTELTPLVAEFRAAADTARAQLGTWLEEGDDT